MNILFMTIAYPKAGEHNIYADLMQEFKRSRHKIYIACSNEKHNNQQTNLKIEDGKNILRIKTGNLTGSVNLIEKGIATISLESTFIKAIKSFFYDVKFDFILYSTPPITFVRAVEFFKKRDKAKTYLLLKDIFPQNAVDIHMMKYKSILYKYLRCKEKKLYAISDYIGCMSQANVDFIIKNNQEIAQDKVEVCPNSIALSDINKADKDSIRVKYNIPTDCIAFIYGGNLGKPQGIDFIVECLKKNMNHDDRFFVICGKGVDYYKLEEFCKDCQPKNVLLINGLPKEKYDILIGCCDIGLIFLDHRFTIPNFPSRLLSYMEYSMPIVASTDINTDIGRTISEGEFGWSCESNDSTRFKDIVNLICLNKDKVSIYGANARRYLEKNYTVETSYSIIMKHFN